MTEKTKLYIFIRNVDDFLRGEYDWCFSVSTNRGYGGDIDNDYYYPLFASFDVDLSDVDTAELTKIAVGAIDREIEKVEKDTPAKLEMLEVKKSKLLFLTPGTGEKK